MLSALSLGVLGVTATQINTAIDSVFARFACLEGPVYLSLAIHLQQLPLALFGVGVAAVLLPALSRTNQIEERTKILEYTLSNALFMLIPCTVAIFVGASSSINLLYGRGHFDNVALAQTTHCLLGYGLGLVPMALTLFLSPVFYAQKDYKTPTLYSLIAIGVNLGLNILFVSMFHLGPASLAYSTSLAAMVNALLLLGKLKSVGICFSPLLRRRLLATTACALLAGSVSLSLGYHNLWQWEREFSAQVTQFLVFFGSFVSSFFLAALCFMKNEIFTFLRAKR